jgi:hypothetical protein
MTGFKWFYGCLVLYGFMDIWLQMVFGCMALDGFMDA